MSYKIYSIENNVFSESEKEEDFQETPLPNQKAVFEVETNNAFVAENNKWVLKTKEEAFNIIRDLILSLDL